MHYNKFDPYTDIHISPFELSHSPHFLDANKYLGEFKTEVDKARVRYNLGIPDDFSNSWGNISGSIENLTDLYEILLNLLKSHSKVDGTLTLVLNKLNSLGIVIDGLDIVSISEIIDKVEELDTKYSNLIIPTKLSDLTNDSGYITSSYGYSKYEIDSKLSNISFDEVLFKSSPAYTITLENINNWNSNKNYTETDPIFKASPSYNISELDINKWNTTYDNILNLLTKINSNSDSIQSLLNKILLLQNKILELENKSDDEPEEIVNYYIGYSNDPTNIISVNTYKVSNLSNTWNSSNIPGLFNSGDFLIIGIPNNKSINSIVQSSFTYDLSSIPSGTIGSYIWYAIGPVTDNSGEFIITLN